MHHIHFADNTEAERYYGDCDDIITKDDQEASTLKYEAGHNHDVRCTGDDLTESHMTSLPQESEDPTISLTNSEGNCKPYPYVCMYICTYVCTYIHTHVCMYVCTYAHRTYATYVHAYVHTHIHIII